MYLCHADAAEDAGATPGDEDYAPPPRLLAQQQRPALSRQQAVAQAGTAAGVAASVAAAALRKRPSIPVPPARPARAGAGGGQGEWPAGMGQPQQLRSYVVGPHATKAAAALDELRELAASQGVHFRLTHWALGSHTQLSLFYLSAIALGLFMQACCWRQASSLSGRFSNMSMSHIVVQVTSSPLVWLGVAWRYASPAQCSRS